MKIRLALASFGFLLASCHSHQLSEAECATLASREADQFNDQYPPDRFATVNAMMKNRIAGDKEQCDAGSGFNRKDFQCVTSSKNAMETDTCWNEAFDHVKLK